MPEGPVYLDYHATTPCDPAVLEAMLPWFSMDFGNASSRQHAFGWKAAEAVKRAREQVASLVDASPDEIIFTSGATESVNLAVKGAAEMLGQKGRHIITVQTEHSAVLDTCTRLERSGFEVTRLGVDEQGAINSDELAASIRADTILVAVMMANNETGVMQDVSAISAITRAKGVWFFTDATQAVGKIPVSVQSPDVDLMAFSAHKIYGPKGTGALYIRRRDPRVRLMPLIDGGGHERGLRSGTLNVPGIVGFGEAARLAARRLPTDMPLIESLRDRFEASVGALEEVYINGRGGNRLPTVSNISFRYTEGQALLAAVTKKLAVSAGSACASESLEPSHVLTAMGLGRDLAFASLRFSLGRLTTPEDMDRAYRILSESLASVRKGSPSWDLYKKGLLGEAPEWSL
ncbi:MAG: aminotransferase class V-fold PLP-dependent enzyme [Chitinophagaceae bacterium]|jgi:cysteine desulfurase|nr:aminotransferase class V-fold PLP-dependent enzyme [Chitinophagaceae bacterium]